MKTLSEIVEKLCKTKNSTKLPRKSTKNSIKTVLRKNSEKQKKNINNTKTKTPLPNDIRHGKSKFPQPKV